MHLFLYQNRNHQMVRGYGPALNISSTRGQFILDELRRGMKDNFKIFGCNTHPIQQALNQIGNQYHNFKKVLFGHLIEVEDPHHAMWLKLNHDLIIRSGVQFCGHFPKVDTQVIIKYANTIKDASYAVSLSERTMIKLHHSRGYLSEARNTKIAFTSDQIQTIDRSMASIHGLHDEMTIQLVKQKQYLENQHGELFKYLNDHNLIPMKK